MSFYRENVVWEDSQGKWNLAFYDYIDGDVTSDDYDEEWDVEYNDNFHFVSTGHPTDEAAMNASPGNAGAYSVMTYKGNEELAEKLDDKAAQLFEYKRNPSKSTGRTIQPAEVYGPAKERSPLSIAKEYYNLKAESYRYKLNKLSNEPSPELPELEERMNRITNNIDNNNNDKIIEGLNKAQDDYLKTLKNHYDDHKRKHRRGSNNGYENGPVLREIREIMESSKPLVKPAVPKKDSVNTIKSFNKPLSKSNDKASSSFNNGTVASNISANTSSSGGTAGKYHINPETGRPNKCNAHKRGCPFGGADSHYENKDSARKAYESKMKNNTLKTFKK